MIKLMNHIKFWFAKFTRIRTNRNLPISRLGHLCLVKASLWKCANHRLTNILQSGHFYWKRSVSQYLFPPIQHTFLQVQFVLVKMVQIWTLVSMFPFQESVIFNLHHISQHSWTRLINVAVQHFQHFTTLAMNNLPSTFYWPLKC